MKEPKSSYVFVLVVFIIFLALLTIISSWTAIELLKQTKYLVV